MKNKLGYFGFMGLVGLLGLITDNPGFYGFLGFFAYFGFFKVIPDELFELNVQKAATPAFFVGTVITAFTLVCTAFIKEISIFVIGLAINFAASIMVFTIILIYRSFNESNGCK